MIIFVKPEISVEIYIEITRYLWQIYFLVQNLIKSLRKN